jgi:lysozyme family protein
MLPEILRTLEHEGGYNNDPNDAGGETNFGISKRSYPDIDIASLTKEAAAGIYERDFLAPFKDVADIRVRWKLFDIGVNCGLKVASVMGQIASGTPPDGVFGPKSVSNVNSCNPEVVVRSLADLQNIWYLGIVSRKPDQHRFLGGWLRRASDKGEGL